MSAVVKSILYLHNYTWGDASHTCVVYNISSKFYCLVITVTSFFPFYPFISSSVPLSHGSFFFVYTEGCNVHPSHRREIVGGASF